MRRENFFLHRNYSRPNMPIIHGLEKFSGQILHSHEYRKPEEFTGKDILIFGSAFSATDIGVELSTYANAIYMSNRGERSIYIIIEIFGHFYFYKKSKFNLFLKMLDLLKI